MIGRLVARHALGAATAATGRGAAGSGTFSGRAPQLAPLRPAALRWRAHRGVAVAAQAEGLVARINSEMKVAMKAKDAARLDAIRFLNASIKQREIELRSTGGTISDAEVVATIQKLAKQRRDSIESYKQGGRDDLVAKESAELELLESYLPAQLSEDELKAIVAEVIAEVGATNQKAMGAVMKGVSAKAAGRADNRLVAVLVKAALG